MKTTKMILVAVMMAFATLSFAQAEQAPSSNEPAPVPQLSALTSLRTALQNPALALAMHAQLSPEFLQVERPSYIVKVRFNHTIYNIYGTYEEWKVFFHICISPYDKKG